MKGLQNPFLTRSSEEIGGFAEFLEQFDRTPLGLLQVGGILINKFIRSTPGGGKTTLLRLFTPGMLMAIYGRREDQYRDLYGTLSAIGVISDDGPQLIGVRVTCANTYSDIADIGLPPKSAEIAFFRLLNARILLAAVNGVERIFDTAGPEAGRAIAYSIDDDAAMPPDLARSGVIGDILDWAAREESIVCRMIDSFVSPSSIDPPVATERCFVLNLLASARFSCEGRRVALPFLVMLDDVQVLNRQQRKWLIDSVLVGRYRTRVWVSERLDGLDLGGLVSAGDKPGRDTQEIRLEDHWKSQSGRHQFESMLQNIADRRARLFRERAISSFAARLDAGHESKTHQRLYEKAASEIGARVKTRINAGTKYTKWFNERTGVPKNLREEAILWKSVEILFARDDKKAQQTLDFLPDEPSDIDDSLNAGIKSAAELFISRDYGVPYYFGFEDLVRASSHNVDQFLLLAARLFSEVAAMEFMHQGESLQLPPKRQHAIIRDTATEWLDSITKTVRHGRDIVTMISRLGEFCSAQTYQDNAPYAPGVTGVSLLMGDWELLCEVKDNKDHPYHRFTQALRSAIGNNLFDVRIGQRCKGNDWAVLYLNRALCVKYHLPLGFGGFREWSLRDLVKTVGEPKRSQSEGRGV